MGCFKGLLMVYLIFLSCRFETSEAEFSKAILKMMKKVNKDGPYIGVLVPSTSLLQPVIHSLSYEPEDKPYEHIDYAGRRFHIGTFENKNAIVAVTRKGMMNATITTQIMCTLFSIKGIVHFGLAGNTDKDQNLGDIVIPQSWAHTGLWNWQKYGDGSEDKLFLEDDGEFTREYGYLKFGDYTNKTKDDNSADNFLNNIWYQAKEIFHCEEDHASRSTIFWVPVSESLFEFTKELEKMELEECMDDSTCLSETPQVVRVRRGSSANVHLDNAAYKDFLHSKFQVSIVDMESAPMALISYQEKIPLISFRALYEFAGEKSIQSNDQEKTFTPIHVKNLIHVLSRFVKFVHKELLDRNDPAISSM